jgi:hypothetical protein
MWYAWDSVNQEYVNTGVNADGIKPDLTDYVKFEDLLSLSNEDIENIINRGS